MAALLLQNLQVIAQLFRFAVYLLVQIEGFVNLAQAEAEPLATEDEAKAGAVAPAVEALLAFAQRGQQTLVFVEADGAGSDTELSGQVADGIERLAACGILAGSWHVHFKY